MKRKAHGAQEPRHIERYVEVTSTAQRSDSPAQAINQSFLKGIMPIFEYKCLKCDSEFEKLVFGSADASGVQCPGCDSPDVERLFSCFSGVSKGSDGSTRSLSPSACSSCSSGS